MNRREILRLLGLLPAMSVAIPSQQNKLIPRGASLAANITDASGYLVQAWTYVSTLTLNPGETSTVEPLIVASDVNHFCFVRLCVLYSSLEAADAGLCLRMGSLPLFAGPLACIGMGAGDVLEVLPAIAIHPRQRLETEIKCAPARAAFEVVVQANGFKVCK